MKKEISLTKDTNLEVLSELLREERKRIIKSAHNRTKYGELEQEFYREESPNKHSNGYRYGVEIFRKGRMSGRVVYLTNDNTLFLLRFSEEKIDCGIFDDYEYETRVIGEYSSVSEFLNAWEKLQGAKEKKKRALEDCFKSRKM